jgi:hypothetical protein
MEISDLNFNGYINIIITVQIIGRLVFDSVELFDHASFRKKSQGSQVFHQSPTGGVLKKLLLKIELL